GGGLRLRRGAGTWRGDRRAARGRCFPAALATVVALLEHAGSETVRHSLCNLRYGIASEALGLH
ncbi:MAG: hypothetical protein ACKOTE_12450, partial [Opitutaceae bacterium]